MRGSDLRLTDLCESPAEAPCSVQWPGWTLGSDAEAPALCTASLNNVLSSGWAFTSSFWKKIYSLKHSWLRLLHNAKSYSHLLCETNQHSCDPQVSVSWSAGSFSSSATELTVRTSHVWASSAPSAATRTSQGWADAIPMAAPAGTSGYWPILWIRTLRLNGVKLRAPNNTTSLWQGCTGHKLDLFS